MSLFCLAQNIAHRNICLQHLVVSLLAGSERLVSRLEAWNELREHVRIVDFQHAMLAKPNMTSRMVLSINFN